jgi:hypothetical protein
MLEILVDVVFPQSMLDIPRLFIVLPIFVLLMNFASDVSLLFRVKALMFNNTFNYGD